MKNMRLFVVIAISCVLVQAGVVFAGVDAVKVVDPLLPVYNADSLSTAPTRDVMRLVGPRNGMCSAQAVVLGSDLDSVRAEMSPLVKDGKALPAESVLVRYASKEQDYDIGKLDQREGHTTHRFLDAYYDILHATPPADTGVMPVWVTVNIPADTEPGDYEGTLTIDGNTVPVRLTVSSWVCPDPDDFQTHVGTIPSHENLALYYKKEFFSEDHWNLIEQELKLLGKTGCDDLWVPALWDLGYKKGGLALLRFTKEGDKIVPDFSVLERYFKLFKTHVGDPNFIIAAVWTDNPRGRRGRPPQHVVNVVVDGQKVTVPRVYAPGGKEIWKPALDGLRERVIEMDWDPDKILLGLAGDKRPTEEEVAGFKEIGPFGKWTIWTHGRGEKSYREVAPGEKYIFSNGMEIAYYAHPYTPSYQTWARKDGKLSKPKLSDGMQGGWNERFNIFTTTRNDIHKYAPLTQWRGYANGSTLAGYYMRHEATGFAFLWFDWFTSDYQPFLSQWCSNMNRKNSTSLVGPGPEGPLATVRYLMFIEGVQECDARIATEQIVVNGDLPAEREKETREFLQEQIEIRYKNGEIQGGHAGGNLGRPDRMWGRAPWPEWQDNTLELYNRTHTLKSSASE